MCSWNIAGARDKLSQENFKKFLRQYDVIWILETKLIKSTEISGFIPYYNRSVHGEHRGGILLLVKNYLKKYIVKVTTNLESQIWLELSIYPKISFGGVYIPPTDSNFYDHSLFANMTAHIENSKNVIVLGDFNARIGTPTIPNRNGSLYEYDSIQDQTVNPPGKNLINLCKGNSLVIANHLKYKDKCFGGNLSYRQGTRWISEIDLCLIHEDVLPILNELEIRQEIGGSDHAPLCISLGVTKYDLWFPLLLERAKYLGQSYIQPPSNKTLLPKTKSFKEIDMERFKSHMLNHHPPLLPECHIETALKTSFDIVNEAVAASLQQEVEGENEWEISQPIWKRIMDRNDPRLLWKAINWKGEISDRDTAKPGDEQFSLHFQNLLNFNTRDQPEISLDDAPYVPVLDDPFTLLELENVLKEGKAGKSYTGICPGLLSCLPITWITFILTLFNLIFLGLNYPAQWAYSKLIVLFKSGDKLDCGNYRGISIMDTLAKLYDKLLLNRLSLWSAIDKCQAGAQKSRGCIEQIMTLRLLIDLALCKKRKLYILFIDFSKAYDRVPRQKLIEYMKSLGCGRTMLSALRNMYKDTCNVLNATKISTSSGVRQGAPSSGLLFITYVDKMVKMIKESVQSDGFLGRLHALMLMDDTVIMATSRENCLKKLDAVLKFCEEYGMEINEKKTKFFVINSDSADKRPLSIKDKSIGYSEKYMYLGSWFTDDGKPESALKLHEPTQLSSATKFAIFCFKNTVMPYYCKSLVMEAAVVSSVFYGCETWLTSNPAYSIGMYNKMIKCLLGVRDNTSIKLCLVESGKQPARYVINQRMKSFLTKKMQNRDMEEPFQIVYEMCKNANSKGFKFLQKVMNGNDALDSLEKITISISNNVNATKFQTYCNELNPGLERHNAYGKSVFLPDYIRVTFTRLRLMSHNLKIEIGRWSRLPRRERVCQCDRVELQDEKHVLLECPLSAHVRQRQRYQTLPLDSISSLMNCGNVIDLCNFINDTLNIYVRS